MLVLWLTGSTLAGNLPISFSRTSQTPPESTEGAGSVQQVYTPGKSSTRSEILESCNRFWNVAGRQFSLHLSAYTPRSSYGAGIYRAWQDGHEHGHSPEARPAPGCGFRPVD